VVGFRSRWWFHSHPRRGTPERPFSPLFVALGLDGFAAFDLGATDDAIWPRVDVGATVSHETHQGDAGVIGNLDGQGGGRSNGHHHWYPGHGGLLHQFEARPSREHQCTPGQRHQVLYHRPSNDLVHGVVSAHVLPDGDH